MPFDKEYLKKALDNENNESIMELSIQDIKSQKNDILQKLNLSREILRENLKKLKEYRYVNNINDLNYGSFIRWINLTKYDNLILTNGGIVCDIKINNGIEILCRNNYNRFFQIKFDENLIFQKLNNQEKIILQVLKEIKK
tara:strand:+ start:1368 stop:1790 length:423 start_codon:yes stop_codon:yes gene_type:complete